MINKIEWMGFVGSIMALIGLGLFIVASNGGPAWLLITAGMITAVGFVSALPGALGSSSH